MLLKLERLLRSLASNADVAINPTTSLCINAGRLGRTSRATAHASIALLSTLGRTGCGFRRAELVGPSFNSAPGASGRIGHDLRLRSGRIALNRLLGSSLCIPV